MEKEKLTLKNVMSLLGLSKEEQEETKLAETVLEDGTILSYDNLDIDTPVNVITRVEGEDDVIEPAADGDYMISETETIVVVDGKISEVKTEENLEETVDASTGETTELAETALEVDTSKFSLESLSALVDLTKDHALNISLSVKDGVVEWGEVSTYEALVSLKEEKVQLSATNEQLVEDHKKEIEDLKLKHKEQLNAIGLTLQNTGIIQAPVEDNKTVNLSKQEAWKQRKIESLKKTREENN